jgi:hypothetical protein
MKKVIISKGVINEVGDLHKTHTFGGEKTYYIIFINKDELNDYKKVVNRFKDTFNLDEKYKPKKYFLSQYYDGTCCFISKFNDKGEKVKPVTFPSEDIAQEELDFMIKYSPKIFNKFIPKILKYNNQEWK